MCCCSYWCGFPALVPSERITASPLVPIKDAHTLPGAPLSPTESTSSVEAATAFFASSTAFRGACLLLPEASRAGKVAAKPLAGWHALAAAEKERCLFAFVDPCNSNEHPGWPLRCALQEACDATSASVH